MPRSLVTVHMVSASDIRCFDAGSAFTRHTNILSSTTFQGTYSGEVADVAAGTVALIMRLFHCGWSIFLFRFRRNPLGWSMLGKIYFYVVIRCQYVFLHWRNPQPDAVSIQLPTLKPKSSPCGKTFFWALRFKIQKPPVLVDAISNEGSRPIGAPASTLGCRIGWVGVDLHIQKILLLVTLCLKTIRLNRCDI